MNLTDEQWALIQPLLPPPSPYARGRPPADPRAVLDGIFRKIILDVPWYTLPSVEENGSPSWQTCYRAWRRWESAGILPRVYERLDRHLRHQGGLDIIAALWFEVPSMSLGPISAADIVELITSHSQGASGFPRHLILSLVGKKPGPSAVIMVYDRSKWHLRLSSDLQDTWQGATAALLVRDLFNRAAENVKNKGR